MAEPTPTPEPPRDDDEPVAAVMPRWVPVLIGAILVGLAGLAVFTGLRYRDNTLVRMVSPDGPRRTAAQTPAPPGEPDAGSSLVLPGNADAVPAANAPVSGSSRAVITGGPGGVSGTVRLRARRGAVFDVKPEDAMIYVNTMPIGHASQFNSADEVYEFAQPGSYTVRVTAEGYRTREYVVTVAEDAKQDVARISVELEKQ
jgi:hypothetical protein